MLFDYPIKNKNYSLLCPFFRDLSSFRSSHLMTTLEFLDIFYSIWQLSCAISITYAVYFVYTLT